jgi:hypothetical protein
MNKQKSSTEKFVEKYNLMIEQNVLEIIIPITYQLQFKYLFVLILIKNRPKNEAVQIF